MGVGGASTLIAACSRSDSRLLTELPPAGNAFEEPSVLTSSNGSLEVTLRAEPANVSWGSTTRYAYTYNGTTPGPTLRLRPGDQLVINLENGLDDPTNLHTHGLHVSPSGNGDNIFVSVPPGGSRRYSYDIALDHRSGLFWYHPHSHGTVAKQVAAGLAGAIVISDHIDDVAEIAASTERTWILSDPTIGTTDDVLNVGRMDRMAGRQGDTILVNGVERPDVGAEAGSLERWRIVNASSSRYYRLALDDHPLHIIASDGGRLAAPHAVDQILLAPGERTEFLVTPTTAGTYGLWALSYDRGGMGMGGAMMGGGDSLDSEDVVVATFSVIGESPPAELPSALLNASDLEMPTPSTSRVLELGMSMGGGAMSFTIDDKLFAADRTDIAAAVNTIEQWEIRNTSSMDHPLHLHVWSFRVVGDPPGTGWKDTINVPANESVHVVVPFTAISGRTVYHCHILDHEDVGMMGVIDIT